MRTHASDIAWTLSEEERLRVMIGWARRVVKHADAIEDRLRNAP